MKLNAANNGYERLHTEEVQPTAAQRFLGSCWRCIKDFATPGFIFTGVAGSALSLAAKISSYVRHQPILNTTASLGLGAFPIIALEAYTWQAQSIKRLRQMSLMQALVLYELLTNIYLNLPQNEDGSPKYPGLNEAFLTLMVGLTGSFLVFRITAIFAKNLNDVYEPLRSQSISNKEISENPTRLLFEPSSVKACIMTQTIKAALGGSLITLSKLYPPSNPYAEEVGLFVLGHVAGSLLEEAGNTLENHLENKVGEENNDEDDLATTPKTSYAAQLRVLRAGRSIVDTISALSIGALFTVNKIGGFPFIGGAVGYTKARTKRDFSKGELPKGLEPVVIKIKLSCCRIPRQVQIHRQTIITTLFLATVGGWYAWGIDSGVKASKQGAHVDFLYIELSSFVGGIGAGFLLTTLIQKTKRVSLFCNSARFYTGPASSWINVPTLYLLQQLDKIGNEATQNDKGNQLIAPGAAWGLLGLTVGNNLAKSTLNDADPALVTALLTRFVAFLYQNQEQL